MISIFCQANSFRWGLSSRSSLVVVFCWIWSSRENGVTVDKDDEPNEGWMMLSKNESSIMRKEPFLYVWYSICPSVHLSVRLFASLLYFLHHLTNNRTKKATNMEKVKYHSDMGQEKNIFFSELFLWMSMHRRLQNLWKGSEFQGARGQKCPFWKAEMRFLSYNHSPSIAKAGSGHFADEVEHAWSKKGCWGEEGKEGENM